MHVIYTRQPCLALAGVVCLVGPTIQRASDDVMMASTVLSITCRQRLL